MHPLVALMRRYSFGYTATHDFSVCDEVMVPEYELWMGDHRLVGRDENYKPGTRRVYTEFPGLGFAVHEIVCNGDRIAMRFSEHGRSITRGGEAVWGGISMYLWNGRQLIRCVVEQDYWARRDQLHAKVPRPIEPPGMDPWTGPVVPVDPAAEKVATAWLSSGELLDSTLSVLDDEWCAPAARLRLKNIQVRIDDLFSAGSRVPFHVTLDGAYAGGLPGLDDAVGHAVRVPVSGILDVADRRVVGVQAITGRLDAFRQLTVLQETAVVAGGAA